MAERDLPIISIESVVKKEAADTGQGREGGSQRRQKEKSHRWDKVQPRTVVLQKVRGEEETN